MLAEYDSDGFRLIHSDVYSDEPIPVGAIRLRIGGHANGQLSSAAVVTWENLRIHAERIDKSVDPGVVP